MTSTSSAPTPLNFDDGSRIMMAGGGGSGASGNKEGNNERPSPLVTPRGSKSLEEYYEVEHLASEIVRRLGLGGDDDTTGDANGNANGDNHGFLCLVALQFPDELLPDSSDVSWLMEDAIVAAAAAAAAAATSSADTDTDIPLPPPLVFVLGDTTYGSCCPDEVGAKHLDADILVHFGHACLGPTDSLPIVYSFGIADLNVESCVDSVVAQIDESGAETSTSFLILFEVQYRRAAEAVAGMLTERGIKALCGRIPDHDCRPAATKCNEKVHAEEEEANTSACCGGNDSDANKKTIVIGGLEVPTAAATQLSDYMLLYIGETDGIKRQFLNVLLRCCAPGGTAACWVYNPTDGSIDTDPASSAKLSRYLNRRFYLIQKAKLASIVGILVGTLSQSRFRSVIEQVRRIVEGSGRACYTFAVGKVNIAKLANYAEIECFVLIGCTESSVLDDERDFHVPIITPLELEVALGNREWDGFYSYAFEDFLRDDADTNDALSVEKGSLKDVGSDDSNHTDNGGDGDDDDQPFFSPISGKYESVGMRAGSDAVNLKALPGGGQVTEYKSGAAEFWQKREYKGLEADVGANKVMAAVKGQTGIASDYGEKQEGNDGDSS